MSYESGKQIVGVLTVGSIKPIVRPQVVEPNEIHSISRPVSTKNGEERLGVLNGSYPCFLISSYMLFPPRFIVRYCPARMVLIAVSSLISPENPGTSGMTTTT